MERYIGLDVHMASCTAGVLSAKGRRLRTEVIETNGEALIGFLKTIPGNKHLVIEEGTHAAWLHEILTSHVSELVVVGAPKNKGQKSDKIDSFALAEKLRIGSFETLVHKGTGEFSMLNARSKAYRNVMNDSVRVKNRLKAVFRSRGISTEQQRVFTISNKDAWMKKLPCSMRPLAYVYYQELEVLMELRRQAQKDMRKEARKHPVYRTLRSIPGMGPNRVAEMLPIIITPYRFPNKRMFWTYCGLGVVMRSSSDWTRATDRFNNAFALAFRRRIQHREIEKEITRIRIVQRIFQYVVQLRQSIWRQQVFKGEYLLSVWSRLSIPESPRIGYAPLESQIKQWAKESRIEGWFPQFCAEHKCCKNIRCISDTDATKREFENTGKHVTSDA